MGNILEDICSCGRWGKEVVWFNVFDFFMIFEMYDFDFDLENVEFWIRKFENLFILFYRNWNLLNKK